MKRLAVIASSIAMVALVAASLFWWPDFEREEPASAKAEPVSPSPPSESYDVAYHLDGNVCERVDVAPLENYQSDDAWQSEFQDAWAQIAEGYIG